MIAKSSPQKILQHQVPSGTRPDGILSISSFQGSSDGIQMCSTGLLEPVGDFSTASSAGTRCFNKGWRFFKDNRVEIATHRSIHMEDVALCLVFFIPAKQSAAFKKTAGLAQSVSTELYVHSFALSKIYSSSIFLPAEPPHNLICQSIFGA